MRLSKSESQIKACVGIRLCNLPVASVIAASPHASSAVTFGSSVVSWVSCVILIHLSFAHCDARRPLSYNYTVTLLRDQSRLAPKIRCDNHVRFVERVWTAIFAVQLLRLFRDVIKEEFKTESTRKLSNFKFSVDENLVPESFKEYCVLFLHSSRANGVISHPQ